MNASELAFAAAEIMSARGHCKHQLEDEEGRVCYSGALLIASMGNPAFRLYGKEDWFVADPEVSRVIVTSTAILHGEHRERWWSPVEYNNDEGVSGEDVIMLLKITGSMLRDQETLR